MKASHAGSPLSIVALGTYDKGKPRTRILLRGLRENGIQVTECHCNVWGDVEDKSQVHGALEKLTVVWRLLTAYPGLIQRYFQLPKHDVVIIGYLGLFDVLVLWPFVRMRRAFLVWDVFLSLYNTVVEDRKLVGKYSPGGIFLWLMEWVALRLVDLALMDTQAHADYLCATYRCPSDRVARIFVGVEPEEFDLSAKNIAIVDPATSPRRVLFYGQFIPLHGIDVVVRAAKLTEKENIEWLLIGKGQEAAKIGSLIDELAPSNIEWIEWVEYEKLIDYLARSHICLGIFGTTSKAQRVIPNKVFQILMAGRPLITTDTPAIRELLQNGTSVTLIPPGSAHALAEAVRCKAGNPGQQPDLSEETLKAIQPQGVGAELKAILNMHLSDEVYR